MYKVEFTEDEMNSLSGLLDAGVRATGLRSCKEAAILVNKLEKVLVAKKGEDGDVVVPIKSRDGQNT